MGLGSALPAVVSLQIGRLGFSSSDAVLRWWLRLGRCLRDAWLRLRRSAAV